MGSSHLRPCFLGVSLGLLLITHVLGCNDDDGGVGPCIHEYCDPILQITHVRDAQTHEALGVVILTEFSLGGTPVAVSTLIQQFADNVELQGDSLLCVPPCGFGTESGRYEFTAEAPGYTAKLVLLNVEYEESHGGCPSYSSGGRETEIELEPQ